MVWMASHRLGSTAQGATADTEKFARRPGAEPLSNEPTMHTISESVSTPRAEGSAKTARLALVVGALGVVFGVTYWISSLSSGRWVSALTASV